MNIEIIRKEIRDKLKTVYGHDEIYAVCEPYKIILESEINLNPKNIEAYYLLAIVLCEMNDVKLSINILEKCYEENKGTFSDDEYAMWATCHAYFIFDDYGYTENKGEHKVVMNAVKHLKEATKRKSNFHQTYYALGGYYFANELFDKASGLFHTAYSISKNRRHLYSEAISLLASSKKSEGIKILKSLYRDSFIDEELDFQIAFILGRELALMGEINEASKIANILLNKKYDKYTSKYNFSYNIVSQPDEIADFLYILGDFNYVSKFYEDNSPCAEDISWLGQYFYSLKMLEKYEEAYLKLNNFIEEVESKIRKWEIKKCYTDVFENNMKPSIEPYHNIVCECYYIGCPRHDCEN